MWRSPINVLYAIIDCYRRLYTQACYVHPSRKLEEVFVCGRSSVQKTEVHYLYLISWSSVVSRKKCET